MASKTAAAQLSALFHLGSSSGRKRKRRLPRLCHTVVHGLIVAFWTQGEGLGPLMLLLLSMFVLSAATRVELVDEVYPIPAEEWRYVELGLKQQAALVLAAYEVNGGSEHVRLALMRREDMEHLRQGLPHGVMAVTNPGRSGSLRCQARPPGDYIVVVDNEMGAKPASVHLRIWLDFSPHTASEVQGISPERRRTVVLLSFAVFLGIVSWSARKLLNGVRR